MGGVVRAVETGVQKTGQALGISRRPSPQPAAPAAETKPGGAPLANDKMPTRPAADFLYIDELREWTEEAFTAALPVTRARPNSMTLNLSVK